MPRKYAKQLEAGVGKLAGGSEAFVTAYSDVRHIRTVRGMARRLGLYDDAGNLRLDANALVVFRLRKPLEQSGIATPVRRSYVGFVGGGRTIGGAREWVLPADTEVEILKIVRLK